MKGKKGDKFFDISFLTIMFFVLGVLFITILSKTGKLTKDIGGIQKDVYDAYYVGEKSLFVLDQSGKYALSDAIYALGLKGGNYDKSNCGEYLGYAIWNEEFERADVSCYPDPKHALLQEFSSDADDYLNVYSQIPGNNYDYLVDANDKKTTVYGFASRELSIDIKRASSQEDAASKEESIIEYNPPDVSIIKEKVKPLNKDKIIPGTLTPELKDRILYYVGKTGIDVPQPLLFGLIEQESGFNPGVTSPTGCVGLMQICSWKICKANGMGDLKGKSDLAGIENLDKNIECGLIILQNKYDIFKYGLHYKCPSKEQTDYFKWYAAIRGYNSIACQNRGADIDYVEKIVSKSKKYEPSTIA